MYIYIYIFVRVHVKVNKTHTQKKKKTDKKNMAEALQFYSEKHHIKQNMIWFLRILYIIEKFIDLIKRGNKLCLQQQ